MVGVPLLEVATAATATRADVSVGVLSLEEIADRMVGVPLVEVATAVTATRADVLVLLETFGVAVRD